MCEMGVRKKNSVCVGVCGRERQRDRERRYILFYKKSICIVLVRKKIAKLLCVCVSVCVCDCV